MIVQMFYYIDTPKMFSYTLYIKILSVLEMGKYNYCYCIVGEKCGTDYTLNLVFPFSLSFFFSNHVMPGVISN